MNKQKMTPFEQALLDATLEEFADIPEDEDKIDVTFSPAFTAKAEKLVRNTQRKSWRYVNTTMKRVALVAIVAAFLATTAMAIPAVRQAIIKFFLHDEGTHYTVTFDPEQAKAAPNEIEVVYMPTYIPKGFIESDKIIIPAAVSASWIGEDGDWISFDQITMPDNPENTSWYGINAEGVTTETLYLNGFEIRCINDYGRTFVWTDNAYFYNLYCGPTVSDEEMQKIFCSIKIDEDAVIEGAD